MLKVGIHTLHRKIQSYINNRAFQLGQFVAPFQTKWWLPVWILAFRFLNNRVYMNDWFLNGLRKTQFSKEYHAVGHEKTNHPVYSALWNIYQQKVLLTSTLLRMWLLRKTTFGNRRDCVWKANNDFSANSICAHYRPRITMLFPFEMILIIET